jgi:putative oxidoreductase
MSNVCSFGMLIGRILISILFLWSGITKFLNYDDAVSVFQALDLPQAHLWFIAFAGLEILGGLAILLGFYARFGALILILLLIPTLIFFHDFWNVAQEETMQVQKLFFLQDLAIMGGLFYVLCCGSGSCSCCRSKCKSKDKCHD